MPGVVIVHLVPVTTSISTKDEGYRRLKCRAYVCVHNTGSSRKKAHSLCTMGRLKMQDLENDGPRRRGWKMQDLQNDGTNRRADNARPVTGWQDASLRSQHN